MSPELRSPWREFLADLDDLLHEFCALHCIGGFAAVAAYGLPRSTNDLDYYSLVPQHCTGELERIAGEGSGLSRKYKVHVHRAAVASLPESYEERMAELFAGRFKNLRLFVLDPYDLVLSKLSRNTGRDREDVAYLAKTKHLDAKILQTRYDQELKPYVIGPAERHDNTRRKIRRPRRKPSAPISRKFWSRFSRVARLANISGSEAAKPSRKPDGESPAKWEAISYSPNKDYESISPFRSTKNSL